MQVIELLHRHKMVEDLTRRQEGQHHDRVENLVYRQNLVELQRRLEELRPADIAHILELSPLDDRLMVWQLTKSEDDDDILLEIPDAIRETLIADMGDREIVAVTKDLNANELVSLVPELPYDAVHELMESLDTQQRERMRSTLFYEEDQVGALIDFEMVTIRKGVGLEVALHYLRRLKELPGHADKLFMIDYDSVLKGVLLIKYLLVNSPNEQVLEIMATDPVTFHPGEDGYNVV